MPIQAERPPTVARPVPEFAVTATSVPQLVMAARWSVKPVRPPTIVTLSCVLTLMLPDAVQLSMTEEAVPFESTLMKATRAPTYTAFAASLMLMLTFVRWTFLMTTPFSV